MSRVRELLEAFARIDADAPPVDLEAWAARVARAMLEAERVRWIRPASSEHR